MKYYDGYGYNFYYDTYGYYEYSVHPTFSEGTVSMIYLALGVALCVVAIVGSYFEQKKADAKAAEAVILAQEIVPVEHNDNRGAEQYPPPPIYQMGV